MEMYTQYSFINIETGLRKDWYVADMLAHINFGLRGPAFEEHNWREGLIKHTEWRLLNV